MKNTETALAKKKFQLPDTYVIVALVVLLMVVLSWIVPPGAYDYEKIDVNGTMRNVAVDGTFHYIDPAEATRTGLLSYFASFYRGCVKAADIIFIIFTCAGSFGVLVQTGAFHAGIGTLIKKLGKKEVLLVPILMSIFAIGGSAFGMLTEFYGFIPLIVGLGVAMGYDAMFGFAIIILGEYIGFMGSTLNPYTVAVAQSIAGVPLYSGTWFRVICLITFILISVVYVLRYGKKIKGHPEKSVVYGDECVHAFKKEDLDQYKIDGTVIGVMLDVLVTLVVLAYGMIKLGWGYPELAGLFIMMSIVAALICRWSPDKWVDVFIGSMKPVIWGALLTGVAQGIVVVMQDACIMDTLIYSLSNVLRLVPSVFSAQAMLVAQTLFNFLVPSGSGQAAATMPIMAPLADMVGVSRQTAVMAFQFGDGLSNLLWPTCGIVTVCGLGNISLQKWWKWFMPLFGLIFLTQVVFVSIANVIF